MPTLTPFLMFDKGLEEAVAFYPDAFPDRSVDDQAEVEILEAVHRGA